VTVIIKGAHIIDSGQDKPKSNLHFYPHISGILFFMFYIFPLSFINFIKSNAFGFPKPHSPVEDNECSMMKMLINCKKCIYLFNINIKDSSLKFVEIFQFCSNDTDFFTIWFV